MFHIVKQTKKTRTWGTQNGIGRNELNYISNKHNYTEGGEEAAWGRTNLSSSDTQYFDCMLQV